MSRSQRLRLRDLRDIYLLVGACRELKDDPLRWRRQAFEGLTRLTGALVGMGGIMRHPCTPQVTVCDVVEVGWPSDAHRSHWLRYRQDGMLATDPSFVCIDWLGRQLMTRAREQVVDDRAWYNSVGFNEYRRPAENDGWLVSSYRLPGPTPAADMLTLHRALNDGRFAERDRRLLWLLHRELGPLVGTVLRTGEQDPFADLPPRLRQTLDRLLAGDSEKEAAQALGLGVRTVHEYVVKLYRRFGVHSRAELMARCHALRRHAGNGVAGPPMQPG